MTDTPAYRMVLNYLVENADIHNPARPAEIVDGTGLSRTRVYALLTKKANSPSGDETISAGIFLAPETFKINGGRPSKLYYADPKRIQDKKTLAELGVGNLPTPVHYTQFFVQPIQITPSILEGFKVERDVINTVMETPGKPMPDVLLGTATLFAETYDKFPVWYKRLNELRAAAQENWEQVQLGEATLDKELHQDFRDHWSGLYRELIQQATVLRIIMQHPYFDSAPQKLFSEETRKPEVVPPVVKEI